MRITLRLTVFWILLVPFARGQGTGEDTAIEFRVARSVALRTEPRFDSQTIRIVEGGSVMRGYLLEDGEWWHATHDLVRGYVRDSAVDSSGRSGLAVIEARRTIAEKEGVAARVALRDSLRALVSERRARAEFLRVATSTHERAVQTLVSQGVYVSLLTARFLLERRLGKREKEMMKLEEDEWGRHCDLRPEEDCLMLPEPDWGYVLSLENLYSGAIDSVWLEIVVFDSKGRNLGPFVFEGIGPVDDGVPGGRWIFEPGDLPRTTACVELVELEVAWDDGLAYLYAGEHLRMARLLLSARGWPVLDAGPVGARFAERSRLAFGLNEVVLEGDCVVR